MTRQNQYQNLMKMVQANGMIDTNNGQKEYIGLYQEPIQIGTRLGDLVRSGYLISTPVGKKRNVWTLTQKGIDWNGEEIVIKRSWKVKKTRAESEVKQEAKEIDVRNGYIGDHYYVSDKYKSPLVDHTPPYKFSFAEWIKSLFF